ncbi:MAG TPA: RagB/SusD family nutrient uptake outer membrane protein, partial [Chitinophagaceae bacterium]|nr:RagB/SusD family nutrient uptake outer membrane protein [Chitinophagaceae bacterium]
KYMHVLGAVLLLIAAASCKKYFDPSTAIDENSALTSDADIETATIGTYAVLRNPSYVRSNHFLVEYPSDEVAQSQNSSDDLTRAYRYTHIVNSGHATNFWGQAYKVIAAARNIIKAVPDDANTNLRQLKGENLFLRGMMYFNLVRVFGRPYTQNNGNNPGIPLLGEDLTNDELLTVSRSSVADVYEAILADLLKAETMLTALKTNPFASKEVAQALLARVYLYMGNNDKAIEYADKVISSGRYSLLQGSAYSTYFRAAPEGNLETIFCIRHTKTEDEGWSAIGSMYYSGDANGTAMGKAVSGWGEIYASQKYWDFLQQYPEDRRASFISPYRVNGVLQMNTSLTPATPMYYINKYNLQEGIINLSSPVYLRLAEMYLIRAEANAKLGNDQLALDDVNIIRERAGLSGAALHTISSIAGAGKTALDVVLEERWLELAFEGHRAYDLFRNDRPMTRNYPGTHYLNNNTVNQTVTPADNRIIFFIPEAEIAKNSNLTQNP